MACLVIHYPYNAPQSLRSELFPWGRYPYLGQGKGCCTGFKNDRCYNARYVRMRMAQDSRKLVIAQGCAARRAARYAALDGSLAIARDKLSRASNFNP